MPSYPYYGYRFYFRQCRQFFCTVRGKQWFCPSCSWSRNCHLAISANCVCSIASLFLKQLVTQSNIAITSAWKAVASCPSEMCHCILLWYLQIPAVVPYWLQAPSVNQTCPFLSWLGQFFSHSSPVGITIRYLLKVCRRVTLSLSYWTYCPLYLLLLRSDLCPIPSFQGPVLGRL